jgi:hypothetical protein
MSQPRTLTLPMELSWISPLISFWVVIKNGTNSGISSVSAVRHGRHVATFETDSEDSGALFQLIGSRGIVNRVAFWPHHCAVLERDAEDSSRRSIVEQETPLPYWSDAKCFDGVAPSGLSMNVKRVPKVDA